MSGLAEFLLERIAEAGIVAVCVVVMALVYTRCVAPVRGKRR